jgi:hypothetical protein
MSTLPEKRLPIAYYQCAAGTILLAGADPEQNLTGGTTFDRGSFFCELGEFKQFSFIICTNIK